MNPQQQPPSPLPPESPSAAWKFELSGMILFFVVVVGSYRLANALREPVMQHFSLHGGSPGDAPPWYFITQDFAAGVGGAVALLLCLLAAVPMWRWWPSYAPMMVWMPLLWLGGGIAQSWIIFHACPGLLQGQRVTSRWPTFDSYLNDPGIAQANSLVMGGALAMALLLPQAGHQAQLWRARRRAARAGMAES
ncbi:hypothetical protein ACFQDI_20790 [Prosthecobacter fluviatilis]|uniref:DUF1648 domain-containing protein n=2 Tax=Prosthecobacter fluviatilis TaxID=445931 RepID=A0ABW0KVF1_9BACT